MKSDYDVTVTVRVSAVSGAAAATVVEQRLCNQSNDPCSIRVKSFSVQDAKKK